MKILLVIDLQKQFKDNFWNYDRCINYIKSHKDEYFVIATIFENFDNSMFEKYLQRSECKNSKKSDLEFPYDYAMTKTWYSMDITEFIDDKFRNSDIEYYIIGCESDSCIMATAFNFWDKKINFKILSDYIYTNNSEVSNDEILKLLKRNFWDCVL